MKTTEREVVVVYKLEPNGYDEPPSVRVVRVFPVEMDGGKSMLGEFLKEGMKHGVTDYCWTVAIMEERVGNA